MSRWTLMSAPQRPLPAAIPPLTSRQHRNRFVLGVLVVGLSPVVGLLLGDLLSKRDSKVRPLVAVNELPLAGARHGVERASVDQVISAAHATSKTTAVFHPVKASGGPLNAQPIARPEEAEQWFNGRPLRAVGQMTMIVTAYSPDERSCGESADGITASGYSVWTNGMKLVAADTDLLPFGSLISVPGYDDGNIVPVLDRGGAIKGRRLDVLFPTHEQACRFGVRTVEVTVWQYADGQPSDYQPLYNAASSVIARPYPVFMPRGRPM